jgi:dihydropyrimidine dehydrogenase (NAD+) subunit PreT
MEQLCVQPYPSAPKTPKPGKNSSNAFATIEESAFTRAVVRCKGSSMNQHEIAFPELHPPLTPQAAVSEANRCLYCFDAPCAAACPTHIDVPRFIKKIASGNPLGSAETIVEANVLGLSCSRVCPVEVLCEGACVYHNIDGKPITIGLLQRHAMDRFYASAGKLPYKTLPHAKKVACVGAGPASLACAAELRKHGLAVTIFDKRPQPGGLNTYGVAHYKFTPNDAAREVELVRATGVEFRTGISVGENLSVEDLERDFDAIFIGIGLGATQSLGIPGEKLPNVVNALDFIAAYKTAQPLPVGNSVAVIGGGNTAIDAAVAAKLLGAPHVSILYRRSQANMSAFSFEYEHARNVGINFVWNARPVAFTSEAVECDGRLKIPCNTVILAIGQSRLLETLTKIRTIELRNGQVVVNPQTGQTADAKYFAAGDCVNGGREVVDAAAEGKRAAQGILQWLHS